VTRRLGNGVADATDDVTLNPDDVLSLGSGATAEIELGRLGRLVLMERAAASLNADEAQVELRLLRGTAVVSIDRRPGGPAFFVATSAGRIEDVGTVFSVTVVGEVASVAVVEGRVRVMAPSGGTPAAEIGAGEELELDGNTTKPREIAGGSRKRIEMALGLVSDEDADGTRRGKRGAQGTVTEDRTVDPDALFDHAEALLKAGREADALAVYASIMRSGDGDRKADAAFAIGQIHYLSGDAAACERTFTDAMPLFGGTPYQTGAQSYLEKCRERLGRGR
jgi:hypothetical protein